MLNDRFGPIAQKPRHSVKRKWILRAMVIINQLLAEPDQIDRYHAQYAAWQAGTSLTAATTSDTATTSEYTSS